METGEMKVLVTGAEGFIAKNLIAELKNRKCKKIYLYDRNTPLETLEDYALQCNIVIHLAGENRPDTEDAYEKGNVEFTKVLAGLLSHNRQPVHVIFSSSIQAGLHNAYGRSKKKAEDILLDYAKKDNVTLSIYRLPNVFGKWCRPNYNSVVATFCYNAARDEELVIYDAEKELELVYIDDVIRTWMSDLYSSPERAEIYKHVEETYYITVGQLAEYIKGFAAARNKLGICDLRNMLEKKLYSTYMSYLGIDDFKYRLNMHTDNRGSFTEFLKTQGAGQISVNIAKPKVTKGNHWHHTKLEKFLVVSGKALIKLRHVANGQVIEYIVNSDRLEVIDIPAGYIHSITNIGETDLVTVMWANEVFDSGYPDTYYEEI